MRKFKDRTFYLSKNTNLAVFKTAEEVSQFFGARPTAPKVWVDTNAPFFVVRTMPNRVDKERGIIQLIYGEVIGYAGYGRRWTGFIEVPKEIV